MTGLGVRNVHKTYTTVPVLKGVSFDIAAGSITALAGANGAGKSTLVRIMSGDLQADRGVVIVGGREVAFDTPRGASKAGLGVVRQELDLVPSLSVAENLFLAAERPFVRRGLVSGARMVQAARPLLRRVGLDLDPAKPLEDLSIGDRQLVAVARALRDIRTGLLLDEPTSSLSPWEVTRLHSTLRQLAAQGLAILYISHRLEEISALCDRALVLRDGAVTADFEKPADAEQDIARAMIPELAERQPYEPAAGRERRVVLAALGVSRGRHGPASFEVHAGEIVGIFGLVGAGRSTIGRTLAGVHRPTEGEVRLHGRPFTPASPVQAFAQGVAYLSEDRKNESILPGMSIRQNICIRSPQDSSKCGWTRAGRMSEVARAFIERMAIHPPNELSDIATLSGGNQQKTIVSRLLADELSVLILDEPTHGIDVAAKADLLNALRQEAKKGLAVILISSELHELVTSVDRLLIMRRGRVEREITDMLDVEDAAVIATAAGARN